MKILPIAEYQQNTKHSYQPQFGVLNMNINKIRRHGGNGIAQAAEQVKAKLEKLAEGRYIKVKCSKNPPKNFSHYQVSIKVSPYESWFKRMFHPLSFKKDGFLLRFANGDVQWMKKQLVEDATDLVESMPKK